MLADEKKRKLYDEGGEEALKEGGMPSHSAFDVFDMFFGGRTRKEGEKRGRDTVHSLRVSYLLPSL